MEYQEMLKKAISEMPQIVTEKQRFEIPKIQGYLQGNKTMVSNFLQICSYFRRKPEHVLKFLLKELATPGDVRNDLLMLGTKVPSSRINEKIQKYADEYVLCSDCGKPDTNIEKEKDVTILKCTACGSKHPVKRV